MNSTKIQRENSSVFLNREHWIPDHKAKTCFQCNKEFIVLITRRHHCRMCGNVFCAECSNKFLEEPFVFEDEKKIRVCDQCYELSQEQVKKLAKEHNSSFKTGSLTQEGLRFTILMPVVVTRDDQEKEINGSLKTMVQLASKEILGYILKTKGLYDSWYKVLESCVLEPLCEVQTNPIEENDACDINAYIKIKKIPYRDKSQTQLVKGLVVRKNVPHKKMAVRFDNPTILMIGSSIEIYDNGDITSMNQVIENEKRQMTEIVNVIRKCAPNILLVEKTVNRIVQQQLLKHNIPVLFKFKPSQFAKIAWSTGARITTDLRKAEQERDSVLGRCQTFSIVNHENIQCYPKTNEQGEAKFNLTNFDPSLLYISNREDLSHGATITISGPDYKELKIIKECLKKFFRYCRNLVLEKEIILQDMFLYHPERKISKMILQAHEDLQRTSIAAETLPLPYIDYTEIFSKAEICAERGVNHSLYCQKTTESAGYFTRFLAILPKAEDMMSEQAINFTFLERSMINVEDQFDSLNKAEIDALMKEAKNQPRGHLEFLSQLCTTPVFQSVKLHAPKKDKNKEKEKEKEKDKEETCLGHYIRKKLEMLDLKCEKCGRPGSLHTSFYYREGFFVKISSEFTKDGLLKNRRKNKFEKLEKNESGNLNSRDSVVAHMQHEEEPSSGNYFSTFVNFFSKRGEDDEFKRSPMKQMGSSSARQMSRLTIYLECDICKKKVSDESAIKNGYLEYPTVCFLEQFIRSGENVLDIQGGDNHLRNTRMNHYNRECCQYSSKSRVFKFQDVLIKFSKGSTPVYQLDQMVYTSARMIELRKQSENTSTEDKANWAKMILEKYYELVSSSVLRLIEVLLDKTQLNIADDDTITDIINILEKKTMFNNPQNQLLSSSLRVLKNLENIKDQIDVRFNQSFSNHIEVDVLRESLYRQIKMTCEAADLARSEYLNPPKQQLNESKLMKSASQIIDVVELNAVPKLSPTQSIREKAPDDQTLGEVPFYRMLSESMIKKGSISSPVRVSEGLEEQSKKRGSHVPDLNPNSPNVSVGSGGGSEKDNVGNTELVLEYSNSIMTRSNTSAMAKLPKKALSTLRSTNKAYSQAENPDAEEIELMKHIYAGFITYDQDPDEVKHQKFPLISVLEEDPVTSIAFALNCSTYMKEIYLKNDFKEIEKLAHSDQLLPNFEVSLKFKLMRGDENPLMIKSTPQENQMKGICGIVESLIRDLSPQNPSKKGANVPNFDLINDITGLIDLGLPPQMKNLVIERLVCPGFKVNVYYPVQFQTLRLINGITHSDFIKSIAKSFDYSEISGGKSNASFIKSHDGIYILKDMKKFEFKMLTSMIYDYFKYMWDVKRGEHPSLLAKIYGMFEVSIKDGEKYHYILMENLFHDTVVSRIYDLKGSETNRYLPNLKGEKAGKTLLDTNFKIDQNGEPICLERKQHQEVIQALKKDAEFLASMNRIDYSLLLILDDEKHVCKLGIIDYLREYTWDKEVESKAKTIMTGAKPTIIKTSSYKDRFISALEKVFMEVEVKKGEEKAPENYYKIEEKPLKVISQ